MANSGQGDLGDQTSSSAARGPTGAEALAQVVATFEEALQTQVSQENQEDWKTRVDQLRHQVINIHKEINAEAAGLAEKENQLAQEVACLRQESKIIEAHKLSLARMDRHVSRIPTYMPRRNLFQSPQQSTPPGFNIPNQPTPPSRPDRFHTPHNHYNNPTANIMAAT